MSLDASIADYLAGPDLLRSAVAGMTPEQLKARPVPGKWSTLEVVAHIADFETIYAERIKRIIATDRPLLLSADHDAFIARLASNERDLDEELALVEAARRQLATTLRALPADSLDRVGIVRNAGGVEEDRTALRHLVLITGHIPHHLVHIAEKKKALGIA